MSATADPDFRSITLDIADSIATVTFNRPEHRNAWTLRMDAEVGEALARCNADDAVRVVVVTGAGDCFCVGADLSGRDITSPGNDEAPAPSQWTRTEPNDMCKPVIAAMNGHSVGIGITFPMRCDLRIVADTAKVGFPFVRRGVVSELNGHWILPRLVGFSAAAELLLTGRLITGARAAEIGLCSQAVPPADVLPTARELAREVAAMTSPVAVAASKRMLWDALEMSRADAANRELELFRWLAAQPDATEGVASFLERRPPVWSMPPSHPLP
jgi:enoyl-CoA hydratase/carnithine racemase